MSQDPGCVDKTLLFRHGMKFHSNRNLHTLDYIFQKQSVSIYFMKIINYKPKTSKHRWMHATKKVPRFPVEKILFDQNNPPPKVRSSPYFWWYLFLQLNNNYSEALKGVENNISKDLIEDFGDVQNVDFNSWWYNGAGDVFGEPQTDIVMKVIKSENDLIPFDSPDAIMLIVPKHWTYQLLKRRFTESVLSFAPPNYRAQNLRDSKAKYRLGRKWSIIGFENAYKIYCEKIKADLNVLNGQKKTAWADIAIRAQIPAAIGLKEGGHTKQDSDQRRKLTILAKRHFSRAEQYIQASATYVFPSPKQKKPENKVASR